MDLDVKFRRVAENASVPCYGSVDAAGMDLCSTTEVVIKPNETVKIGTGVAFAIPSGFGGFVFARSGLATKEGLAPANKVGVIDSDYRGEVIVALHNHSCEDRLVTVGERIAQLVIMPVYHANLIECESLDDTERGAGGFGSTGTN